MLVHMSQFFQKKIMILNLIILILMKEKKINEIIIKNKLMKKSKFKSEKNII